MGSAAFPGCSRRLGDLADPGAVSDPVQGAGAGHPFGAWRLSDVTEGYAGDWTIEQLRGPAQRIADGIEAMMNAERAEALAGGQPEGPGTQAAE